MELPISLPTDRHPSFAAVAAQIANAGLPIGEHGPACTSGCQPDDTALILVVAEDADGRRLTTEIEQGSGLSVFLVTVQAEAPSALDDDLGDALAMSEMISSRQLVIPVGEQDPAALESIATAITSRGSGALLTPAATAAR